MPEGKNEFYPGSRFQPPNGVYQTPSDLTHPSVSDRVIIIFTLRIPNSFRSMISGSPAPCILVQGAIPPLVEALLDEGEIFLKHFQLDVPPLPVHAAGPRSSCNSRVFWPKDCRHRPVPLFEQRARAGPPRHQAAGQRQSAFPLIVRSLCPDQRSFKTDVNFSNTL
jgi:hypothetical protein